MRRLVVLAASVAALALPADAAATSTYDVRVVGAEVPPITSSLGTFVGASEGPVGAWRIQIVHQPLRTGPTVSITGGSLWLALRTGATLRSAVVGGSVSVESRGAGCANQVYGVRVALANGSFAGTLTHRRASLLGHCVIYAATITGRATLTA